VPTLLTKKSVPQNLNGKKRETVINGRGRKGAGRAKKQNIIRGVRSWEIRSRATLPRLEMGDIIPFRQTEKLEGQTRYTKSTDTERRENQEKKTVPPKKNQGRAQERKGGEKNRKPSMQNGV